MGVGGGIHRDCAGEQRGAPLIAHQRRRPGGHRHPPSVGRNDRQIAQAARAQEQGSLFQMPVAHQKDQQQPVREQQRPGPQEKTLQQQCGHRQRQQAQTGALETGEPAAGAPACSQGAQYG